MVVAELARVWTVANKQSKVLAISAAEIHDCTRPPNLFHVIDVLAPPLWYDACVPFFNPVAEETRMAEVEYTIRKKIFSFLGAKFHIYNAAGDLVGFTKQKAFKLKEDIRVYRDESMQHEMLRIQARSVIDFAAAYNVVNPQTEERIGVLKRAGFSSMLRDSWQVLDGNDQFVGKVEEDSMLMALIRRFLSNLVPQNFTLTGSDGTEYAEYKTHFNPFVHRMTVRVHENCPLDQAVPLAAGILLVAIEGRQG